MLESIELLISVLAKDKRENLCPPISNNDPSGLYPRGVLCLLLVVLSGTTLFSALGTTGRIELFFVNKLQCILYYMRHKKTTKQTKIPGSPLGSPPLGPCLAKHYLRRT